MRKVITTIALTLLIAILCLGTVGLLFWTNFKAADTDPNTILARKLMPYLKDGQTFRLADAYPDPWESVQVVRYDDALDDSTWRALLQYNLYLSDTREGEQMLIFWHAGAVAQVIRFTRGAGMPRFSADSVSSQANVLSRGNAVFRATLIHDQGVDYYACVRESASVDI